MQWVTGNCVIGHGPWYWVIAQLTHSRSHSNTMSHRKLCDRKLCNTKLYYRMHNRKCKIGHIPVSHYRHVRTHSIPLSNRSYIFHKLPINSPPPTHPFFCHWQPDIKFCIVRTFSHWSYLPLQIEHKALPNINMSRNTIYSKQNSKKDNFFYHQLYKHNCEM